MRADKYGGDIQLNPAFMFDCEACGRENFVRSILTEQEDDDVTELVGELNGEECQRAWTSLVPEQVTCTFCGCWFDVVFDEDDE